MPSLLESLLPSFAFGDPTLILSKGHFTYLLIAKAFLILRHSRGISFYNKKRNPAKMTEFLWVSIKSSWAEGFGKRGVSK